MLNGWPPGTSNYTAAFAHRKRSKDGHQVHYELVRIQIRPLSFDTPDIWALLPFFPPLYRCGSQNHRHSTYFCLSRSSWAFLKIKDLVLVFKELCLEGGWRAFLLPSAESFTRELPIKSKWPTRFSRIGHSPAPARYSSRHHPCRYSLPLLVCHALHSLRQDLGKQQTLTQRSR